MNERNLGSGTKGRSARRPSGDVTSWRYTLGWCLLWFVAHMTTLAVGDAYFVDTGSREGFAALMGMGMPGYLTVGMLASYFVAKVTRRSWTFFAGALVVGFGVGGAILVGHGDLTLLAALFYVPLHGLAVGGVVLVVRGWIQRRLQSRRVSSSKP